MQKEMVVDPVCGLEVNPREAPYTSTYGGRTYYFSDPDCKRMFDEDPETYVKASTMSRGGMGSKEGGRGPTGGSS